MADETLIHFFDGKQIRYVWNEEEEKYYFSIVDVVSVLTEQPNARGASTYWAVLKNRLKEEGADELLTNCKQLKLRATDGKNRLTDVADLEQMLRIIQSIPSKKAEPVKKWLAGVGAQRIDQMIDPELTFQMAVEDYRRQGYSDRWINERMRSIEMRKELTDEWHRSGIHEPKDFTILTNVLTKAWSGMTTGEYKRHKGLTKQNLRDNMTNIELALNTLAEVATTEISKERNAQGMKESRQAAQAGGQIAKNTRNDLERQLGRTVISSERASDYIRPIEQADAKELPDAVEEK